MMSRVLRIPDLDQQKKVRCLNCVLAVVVVMLNSWQGKITENLALVIVLLFLLGLIFLLLILPFLRLLGYQKTCQLIIHLLQNSQPLKSTCWILSPFRRNTNSSQIHEYQLLLTPLFSWGKVSYF